MTRSIILACGNPLRGDDGVAPQIARNLEPDAGPGTEVLCVHQWTPELAESLSKSELAIFVDASAAIAAGEIYLQEISARSEKAGVTTHSLNPRRLLALARELYQKEPERAFLLTVGGASFEYGAQLSDVVRRAVPAACNQVKALLSGGVLPAGGSAQSLESKGKT